MEAMRGPLECSKLGQWFSIIGARTSISPALRISTSWRNICRSCDHSQGTLRHNLTTNTKLRIVVDAEEDGQQRCLNLDEFPFHHRGSFLDCPGCCCGRTSLATDTLRARSAPQHSCLVQRKANKPYLHQQCLELSHLLLELTGLVLEKMSRE